MEVDDGLVADSVFTNFGKSHERSVRFDEPIDIPVDVELHGLADEDDESSTAVARPKHKPRRRSRNSSSSKDDDDQTPVQRTAVAPTKLRKLSEKDRHVSRSGKGRGKPKKGTLIIILCTCFTHDRKVGLLAAYD